jgi:ketosteroid isomerase-like protein
MDSREVVEAFFTYWGVQDVELTSALFADDIVYKLHWTTDNFPFGREWRGAEACRQALFSTLAEFDYLSYVSTIVSAQRDVVRAQVQFVYRHRRTGGVLEGTRRFVFKVRNGMIVRIEGYHDARLIDAFMRLTESRLAACKELPASVLSKWEPQGLI